MSGMEKIFVSYRKRPDPLWGPPSLLFNKHRNTWVNLTSHFHPVSVLRMRGAVPPVPICHQGVHRDNFISKFTVFSTISCQVCKIITVIVPSPTYVKFMPFGYTAYCDVSRQ